MAVVGEFVDADLADHQAVVADILADGADGFGESCSSTAPEPCASFGHRYAEEDHAGQPGLGRLDGGLAHGACTGKVTGLCKQRHRHQEFLAFLKHLARAYPTQQLHLVMDNYATHKRPEIKAWLAANPRIHVHFTPTSGSWLNLVEVWFGIIERQAIRRGVFPFRPRPDDQDPRLHRRLEPPQAPFIWTRTPEEILTELKRERTSSAPH